jgi:hypothetical protein
MKSFNISSNISSQFCPGSNSIHLFLSLNITESVFTHKLPICFSRYQQMTGPFRVLFNLNLDVYICIMEIHSDSESCWINLVFLESYSIWCKSYRKGVLL